MALRAKILGAFGNLFDHHESGIGQALAGVFFDQARKLENDDRKYGGRARRDGLHEVAMQRILTGNYHHFSADHPYDTGRSNRGFRFENTEVRPYLNNNFARVWGDAARSRTDDFNKETLERSMAAHALRTARDPNNPREVATICRQMLADAGRIPQNITLTSVMQQAEYLTEQRQQKLDELATKMIIRHCGSGETKSYNEILRDLSQDREFRDARFGLSPDDILEHAITNRERLIDALPPQRTVMRMGSVRPSEDARNLYYRPAMESLSSTGHTGPAHVI